MSYPDLQEFLDVLEARGLLLRIKEEVDPVLEITEITARVCKACGPALFFENVRGSSYPVVTNIFGSLERLHLAFKVDSLEDIAGEIDRLIRFSPPSGILDKLKAIPQLARLGSFMPKIVEKGRCQEVIDKIDLLELPVLKCWPQDAGRFITLPLVFSRDPETQQLNMGMYRLQVFDSATTGMHWHLQKDGAGSLELYRGREEIMPVAVALGCDPVTIYAATAPLPKGISELVLAGFLRKAPVELVRCRTIPLEVPAHAEFILEGYVDPSETRLEGPFGDHTGFYSLAEEYPVFHITCMTRKRYPVYPATIVGRPPMEDCFIAKATERFFLPLLRLFVPEVVDMNLPMEGVFHNCAILSIKKRYPGQAKKVMHSIWGLGQMMFTKMIIIVDDDVNPHDLSTVAWKVFNNIDARRDVVVVDGPLDALDHSSPLPRYGGKMGIDATRKGPGEGHARPWPDDVTMSEEIKNLVDGKWELYGMAKD